MKDKQTRSVLAALLFGGLALVILASGCNRESVVEQTLEKPMTTRPIVYVALGDSTGSGVGAREGGYVLRLFNRLVKRLPESRLTNLCVSGATTADVVRGQLQRAVALNPDLITVGVGINDIGHGLTLEQFSKNYEQILTTLREKTRAQIVVTNLPDVSSAPRIPNSLRQQYQQEIMRFSQRLEEIAAGQGVTVFDIYTITHEQLASHPEYFSADGFHPSDEGYEFWTTQMWPTVAKVVGVEK